MGVARLELLRTVVALSVRQPWAQLIALGAKRYETRSWSTQYRGLIAIHAGRRWTDDERAKARLALVTRALRAGGMTNPEHLPRGAIIATAQLVAVHCTESIVSHIDERERSFGSYENGRFAWE